jgi:lipoprotein signal peptidase
MNQTFSISRFGRLARKYFTDNRGQLLANTGLLVGGMFVLCLFTYQSSPASVSELRTVLFFGLGWPCWYVFTVQQTAVLNHKERAISYLLQPASQAEKMVLIWLVSGLGFVVVYFTVFTLFDALGTSYVNHRDWTAEQLAMMRRQGSLFELKPLLSDKGGRPIPNQLWAMTALLHSFTLVLSLLIRRYTLPLVVVIAFALLIFGVLGNNLLLHMLTGYEGIGSKMPFDYALAQSPVNQYQYRAVEIPQPIGNQIRYLVGVTAVILLYITGYVRLKEWEV